MGEWLPLSGYDLVHEDPEILPSACLGLDAGRLCTVQRPFLHFGCHHKVNDVTFADTLADGPGGDITSSEGYRSLHQVPFHMVSRVERNGDRFILRPLMTKQFSDATKEKPIASWILQTDYETTVFNASSADWVEFLKTHGKDESLFSEESQLVFLRQTDQ
ncbi:MAG: hypothetical protein HYY48_11245 [Gammaproteobacteria bacterium]|nr:hypothetical protein [Gammaproteobacteria bacterium]